MTFSRLATALCLAIAAVHVLGWLTSTTPDPACPVIIPVRPSLVREANALTLVEHPPMVPRVDGRTLATALQRMNQDPSLALTPVQRRVLLAALRASITRGPGTRTDTDLLADLRTKFMATSLALLQGLRPPQVRYIVEHREDCNITFEASYWPTLVQQLQAPTPSRSHGTR